MRKRLASLLAAALIALLSVGLYPSAAFASTTIEVADYGADGLDALPDATAIRDALYAAKDVEGGAKVHVPAGTYLIDHTMHIFSNTTLELDEGAIMLMTGWDGFMLIGAHTNEDGSVCYANAACKHGGHNQAQNVSILGGVWDCGTSDLFNTGAIIIAHARNTVVSGSTFVHGTNHIVNLSGSENVLVENCHFKDAVRYDGDDPDFWSLDNVPFDKDKDPENREKRYSSIEALHFDFISEGDEGTHPKDDTPMHGAQVINCSFTNVLAGVGTHHLAVVGVDGEQKSTGEVFEGCTFTNIASHCIDIPSSSGTVVKDCTVDGAKYFVMVQDTDGAQIYDNEVRGITANALHINSGSEVWAMRNTFDAPRQAAAHAFDGGILHISDCTISSPGTNGILAKSGGFVDAQNVQVSNAGNAAFCSDDATFTLSGCTIEGGSEEGVQIIGGSSACAVSDCTISACAGNGVYVGGASEASVTGCTISSPGLSGISVAGNSTVSANDNIITNPAANNGIAVKGASTVVAERNTIIGANDAAVYVVGSTIKFSDGSIEGGSAMGIQIVGGSTACEVANNTISSCAKAGIYVGSSSARLCDNRISSSGTHGIRITGAGTVEVDRNTVNSPGERGIFAGLGASVTISENTIDGPTSEGIMLDNAAQGAIVSNNNIKESGSFGIDVRNSESVAVSSNTVSGAKSHGIYVVVKAVATIKDNKVDNAAKNGIRASGEGAVEIGGNIVSSPGNMGIFADGGASVSITDNTVSGSKNHGISIDRVAQGALVSGNTVEDIENSKVFGINVLNSESVMVSENTVTNVKGHGIYAENGTVTIKDNRSASSSTEDKEIMDIRIGVGVSAATVTGNVLGERGYSAANGSNITYEGNKTDLSFAKLDGIENQSYTGSAIKLPVTVTFKGAALTQGSDYTIAYANNTAVGTATVTVTGKGNYAGTLSASFKIEKASLSKATVSSIGEKTWTGAALTPAPTVKMGSTSLKKGTDYTLSYASNTNVGTATVTITGKGNYTGSKKVTFKIVAANLSKATVSSIGDKTWTGKALTPAPTVKMGSTSLRKGTDYTLSYASNTNVGTATVTITGKGNYSGSKKATFKIVPLWTRLEGKNALATMAAITQVFGTADTAIVATNADFKDSLAAAALAGSLNAPLLTTKGTALSAQTSSEIRRMGVKTVYIVGSTKEVAAAVESKIRSLSGVESVTRVSGSTPSARAIASAKAQPTRSDTVIIATQKSFKDALSISPYAYATASPVLYVETSLKLSSASVAYIKQAGFKKAIIVGGPIAIPESVEKQLTGAGIAAGSITRLAGSNSYRTSRVIAEWAQGKLKNGTGGSGVYQYASIKFQPSLKLGADKLGISRGDGWKDALAGAALCGKNRSVMLLADAKNTSNTTVISASKASINQAYVFGGPIAVSEEALGKLVAASK